MINIHSLTKYLCPLVLALSLTACGTAREYSSIDPGNETARSRARLEVPPDLVNTTSDSLIQSQQQVETTEEVLPEPKGLKVERNDREGWVEAQAPADQVWNRLVSHWGALGVDLVVADPKTGVMETDWVKPAKSKHEGTESVTENALDKILGRLIDSPTSLDKFTLRLERVEDNRSRVYVSHKGIKKIQTEEASLARNADWEWVETEEDPEKVKRALSSIVYGLDAGASPSSPGQARIEPVSTSPDRHTTPRGPPNIQ